MIKRLIDPRRPSENTIKLKNTGDYVKLPWCTTALQGHIT